MPRRNYFEKYTLLKAIVSTPQGGQHIDFPFTADVKELTVTADMKIENVTNAGDYRIGYSTGNGKYWGVSSSYWQYTIAGKRISYSDSSPAMRNTVSFTLSGGKKGTISVNGHTAQGNIMPSSGDTYSTTLEGYSNGTMTIYGIDMTVNGTSYHFIPVKNNVTRKNGLLDEEKDLFFASNNAKDFEPIYLTPENWLETA